MNLSRLRELAESWRAEAELYRRRGMPGRADMAESYAADLETALWEWQLEVLTLEKASAESGYSYSTLQKKLASGELPNVGEKGSPRISRRDLPMKGGSERVRLDTGEPDIAGEILARMGASPC